jgi:hypothetical protein
LKAGPRKEGRKKERKEGLKAGLRKEGRKEGRGGGDGGGDVVVGGGDFVGCGGGGGDEGKERTLVFVAFTGHTPNSMWSGKSSVA